MSLKIDLGGEPLPLAEITTVREAAVRERATFKGKTIKFLIITATIILSVLSYALFVAIPTLRDPMTEPTIVAVTAYFTPYLVFPVFIISLHLYNKKIEKPAKALDATIKALTVATAEELAELGDARSHHHIDAYWRRVEALGRGLVQGEVEAMRQWCDKHAPNP